MLYVCQWFWYISEFSEFILNSARNFRYTHTHIQTECPVFYQYYCIVWVLLCICMFATVKGGSHAVEQRNEGLTCTTPVHCHSCKLFSRAEHLNSEFSFLLNIDFQPRRADWGMANPAIGNRGPWKWRTPGMGALAMADRNRIIR